MRRLVSYIGLLVVLLVPCTIRAASVSVGLDCPTSASVGETITCSITINSDVKVNGLVANYTLNGASFVSFTPNQGFTSNYTSGTGFNIGNTSGRSGAYTIGYLKMKVNSATTIMLKNIDVSDVDFNSYSSSNRSATIRLKSTNNNLGGLSLSNGTLSPSFNANTTSYTSTINDTSVTISATKGDNYQSISGTGKKNLIYGKNTFKVVVKSESGASKTYTIVITRPDSRNSDNSLKSLSVDQGSISFKKDTLNYSLKVGKDVSSIKVNAAVNNSLASFVKGYGPRSVNLNYGVNNILIKVKAENESVRTYTIKVTREDERSSNTNLSSISLSSGNISFSKDVTEYSVSVPYETTRVDVTAYAEDSKAKVNVASPNLVVGDNTVLITVTAESGQSKIYKIIVKRLPEQAVLSDNNNVSSIDIKGHGIEFNQETKEYEVSIGDEYALVIDVLLEDPSAKYVIEGNEDLKDGSVIKITSTSESGEIKEYKLNIKKELSAVPRKNGNGLVSGLIGFVLGLFTMFVTITLVNKMKSRKVSVATASVAPTSVSVAPQAAVVTKPAPVAPAPESKPAPVVETKPVVQATAQPVTDVKKDVVQPASVSVQTTVAPKPVQTVAPAASKPVMQEANVAQPTSKTANVIPENKTQ